MRVRYANWVNGLNSDWLISRQRFFGVALPLWYRLDGNKEIDYENPILPNTEHLPIDPMTQTAPGFDESQRNQPNGFIGDDSVMDTWATSSLTPQIVSKWSIDQNLFKLIYPMDLRPQGQDIIRTWLFSTIVRSELLENKLPWANATISGWILDPDRKKMSKSKGNVVTPKEYLEQYSSDAVRYWSASAKLGQDATFDEGVMKNGRRLAIKILNAGKFVLNLINNAEENNLETNQATNFVELSDSDLLANVQNPTHISLLLELNQVIAKANHDLDNYEHMSALLNIETFFWKFCDDYIEYAKPLANLGDVSTLTTLFFTLDKLLKLLNPYLPFSTSEVYSWYQTNNQSSEDLALQPYPQSFDLTELSTKFEQLDLVTLFSKVSQVLAIVRGIRSANKIGFKTPIPEVNIKTNVNYFVEDAKIIENLKNALNVEKLNFELTTDDLPENFELVNFSI